VVQDQAGVSGFCSGQADVDCGKVTGGKLLVGPGEYDALVLDKVQKVSRVVLIAQGEGAAFMWLYKRLFLGERQMSVLIEQCLEDFRRWRSQFDDLINVLRLEFHNATGVGAKYIVSGKGDAENQFILNIFLRQGTTKEASVKSSIF